MVPSRFGGIDGHIYHNYRVYGLWRFECSRIHTEVLQRWVTKQIH